MNPDAEARTIAAYRQAFLVHGDAPEALLWSPEGQRWRLDKLVEMALALPFTAGQQPTVLDVGCGLGHLYPLLRERMGEIAYTGIDVVPELIEHARRSHPAARFRVCDLSAGPLDESYDFVFISGVFNAPARADAEAFMSALLAGAFRSCHRAMCFNFTSRHVNFTSEDANYFDPGWVLNELAAKLSPAIEIHHHYRNCDVAVCVRK